MADQYQTDPNAYVVANVKPNNSMHLPSFESSFHHTQHPHVPDNTSMELGHQSTISYLDAKDSGNLTDGSTQTDSMENTPKRIRNETESPRKHRLSPTDRTIAQMAKGVDTFLFEVKYYEDRNNDGDKKRLNKMMKAAKINRKFLDLAIELLQDHINSIQQETVCDSSNQSGSKGAE